MKHLQASSLDVSDVAGALAQRAVEVRRSKQAADTVHVTVRRVAKPVTKQAAGGIMDTVSPYLSQAKDYLTQNWDSPSKWNMGQMGLAGAGVGALAGGLSSLTGDEEEKHPFRRAMTGALLGGLGGVGTHLIKEHWPQVDAKTQADKEQETRAAATAAVKAHQAAGGAGAVGPLKPHEFGSLDQTPAFQKQVQDINGWGLSNPNPFTPEGLETHGGRWAAGGLMGTGTGLVTGGIYDKIRDAFNKWRKITPANAGRITDPTYQRNALRMLADSSHDAGINDAGVAAIDTIAGRVTKTGPTLNPGVSPADLSKIISAWREPTPRFGSLLARIRGQLPAYQRLTQLRATQLLRNAGADPLITTPFGGYDDALSRLANQPSKAQVAAVEAAKGSTEAQRVAQAVQGKMMPISKRLFGGDISDASKLVPMEDVRPSWGRKMLTRVLGPALVGGALADRFLPHGMYGLSEPDYNLIANTEAAMTPAVRAMYEKGLQQ